MWLKCWSSRGRISPLVSASMNFSKVHNRSSFPLLCDSECVKIDVPIRPVFFEGNEEVIRRVRNSSLHWSQKFIRKHLKRIPHGQCITTWGLAVNKKLFPLKSSLNFSLLWQYNHDFVWNIEVKNLRKKPCWTNNASTTVTQFLNP